MCERLPMSDQQTNRRADPARLQFGTRGLLVGTAVCAVLVLVFQRLGPVWGTSAAWFLMLAAAHVLANVHGSRRLADRESLDGAADPAILDLSSPDARERAILCAPATRLRDCRGLGRVLLAVTSLAAVAGLVLGTVALVMATRADAWGIALGGVSAGILGGFLGFVSASFVIVATRSFREATNEHHGDEGARHRTSA